LSHFSRIRTTFRHRAALVRCLQELGYEVTENTTVQGHHGCHEVDIAATTSRGNGIGFVQNGDGSYDMVSDWWGVRTSEKRMATELKARAAAIQKEYAKKMVLEQTKADGFELVSETEDTDGTIRLVVRRWA
jgi:hypothetical protein